MSIIMLQKIIFSQTQKQYRKWTEFYQLKTLHHFSILKQVIDKISKPTYRNMPLGTVVDILDKINAETPNNCE